MYEKYGKNRELFNASELGREDSLSANKRRPTSAGRFILKHMLKPSKMVADLIRLQSPGKQIFNTLVCLAQAQGMRLE